MHSMKVALRNTGIQLGPQEMCEALRLADLDGRCPISAFLCSPISRWSPNECYPYLQNSWSGSVFLKFPLPGSPSRPAPQSLGLGTESFLIPPSGQELFPSTLTLEPFDFYKRLLISDLSTLLGEKKVYFKEMNGLGEDYDDGENPE